jgi:hypothetical protein
MAVPLTSYAHSSFFKFRCRLLRRVLHFLFYEFSLVESRVVVASCTLETSSIYEKEQDNFFILHITSSAL